MLGIESLHEAQQAHVDTLAVTLKFCWLSNLLRHFRDVLVAGVAHGDPWAGGRQVRAPSIGAGFGALRSLARLGIWNHNIDYIDKDSGSYGRYPVKVLQNKPLIAVIWIWDQNHLIVTRALHYTGLVARLQIGATYIRPDTGTMFRLVSPGMGTYWLPEHESWTQTLPDIKTRKSPSLFNGAVTSFYLNLKEPFKDSKSARPQSSLRTA